MATDLNKLKLFLRPTTLQEVLRVRGAEEETPDEPGFAHPLEADMRNDFFACADATQWKKTGTQVS